MSPGNVWFDLILHRHGLGFVDLSHLLRWEAPRPKQHRRWAVSATSTHHAGERGDLLGCIHIPGGAFLVVLELGAKFGSDRVQAFAPGDLVHA